MAVEDKTTTRADAERRTARGRAKQMAMSRGRVGPSLPVSLVKSSNPRVVVVDMVMSSSDER